MFPNIFICATYEYNTSEKAVPAPLMRRKFRVDNAVEKAEFIIGTGGYYEAYINGKNITKGPLAPYRANNDHFIYMDKYDVTENLRNGENVIALILGNGMQNSVVNQWEFKEITHKNGEERIIESDTQTLTHPSPIIFNDFHQGEHYDARKEIFGWNDVDFDDGKWNFALPTESPRGEKCICEAEPIVIREERKPVSITPYENGYIYDFGLNDAGVCRLKIKGEEGQKLILRHFETYYDGKPYYENIRFSPEEIFQVDEFTCSGRMDEFTPKFTYHGFRYVYVENITESQASEDLLTFLVMSSDLKVIGSFECDNEVVNKIQEATVRSDFGNFYYFPTDCPQREKNGWTADASLSAEQMLLNLNPEKSYKVWLQNIYKALSEKGQLPGIVPTATWGYEWGNGPAWDNVIVNIPYYTYLYRGDKSIFSDIVSPLMRYLTYLYSKLDEKSLIAIGLGDWCQPKREYGADFTTPLVVSDSILTYDIAKKSAFIFDVLGKTEQKEYAEKLAQRVKNAILEHLINKEDCTVYGNTQTAQAMAIYYNIFDESQKQKAVEYLVELVKQNDYFMDTGVLGARVIFHVLAENGYADLAFEMITRPEYPSYGNWILRGATTLWEGFFEEKIGLNSMNHHFWGDVSAWFYKQLAGIQINPTGRNVREIEIKPCFVGKLNYVKASHILPDGEIFVEWTRKEDVIELNIKLPENVSGKLILKNSWKIDDEFTEIILNKTEYFFITKNEEG